MLIFATYVQTDHNHGKATYKAIPVSLKHTGRRGRLVGMVVMVGVVTGQRSRHGRRGWRGRRGRRGWRGRFGRHGCRGWRGRRGRHGQLDWRG